MNGNENAFDPTVQTKVAGSRFSDGLAFDAGVETSHSCFPPPDVPLVSVVVPTYNRADRIQRCLDSVFAQTWPRLEVVVVDDGSTDGTAELLQETYGDRIRLIRQSNQGQSAATRAGMEVCTGEYLAFLDSDDYWLPGKTRLQVDMLLTNSGAVAVHSNAREFQPGRTDTTRDYFDLHPILRIRGMLMAAMVKAHIPLRSTVLCRRSFLIEHGILPDPEAQGTDDIQMLMEITGHGGEILAMDTVTTYREFGHGTNFSTDHYQRFCKRIPAFENMLVRNRRLPRAWMRQVRRAYADALFRIGEHHWGKLEKAVARKYYLRSIAAHPLVNVRACVFLGYTLLPDSVVRAVRSRRSANSC